MYRHSKQRAAAFADALGRGQAIECRRRDIFLLAAALLACLGLAFVILVTYGEAPEAVDLQESLLLIGLLALLTCAVAYFADKEREHRRENQRLLHELHDTARALDARVARLNQLCETSAHLAGTLDLERISELIVAALTAQLEADAASVVVVDKSQGRCLVRRSGGPLAEKAALNHRDVSLPPDPESIAEAAAEAPAPAVEMLALPPELATRMEAWSRRLATIYAPMKVSDLVRGAVAAIRCGDFTPEDLSLLTTLANMASKAIQSAELHQALRQSYFQTLHVLARTLAARDPYSAAHGEAVTQLAVALAEKMGLASHLVEAVRAYGPLHDLGKIGIADAVLLKAGPLTQEEAAVCRQHTVIGEEIIRPLNPGPEVLGMIRSHHERWDGQGYPDGLSGKAIPVLARVVAVADAFHAMTSHRPYRAATVLHAAVKEIRALAGEQFDPEVVAALASLWDTGQIARFYLRTTEPPEPPGVLNRSAPPLTLAPP